MPHILVADDEQGILDYLKDVLEDMHMEDVSFAHDGKEAEHILEHEICDILITDLKMPQIQGDELLSIALDKNPHTIVIILSGYGKIHDCIRLLKQGAYDYIQKPFQLSRLKNSILNAVDKYDSYQGMIQTHEMMVMLLKTLEHKDPFTKGHCENVSRIATQIGKVFDFPKRRLKILKLAALFHDLGKVGVDDRILTKPGPLTSEEYEVIKKHPIWSADIVAEATCLKELQDIIINHHERFDGKGYPYQKEESEIPLEAKIISVADAYDAMTNARCYRPAMSSESAIQELIRNAGTQFDPAVVSRFLEILSCN